jgi:hypothetical protein
VLRREALTAPSENGVVGSSPSPPGDVPEKTFFPPPPQADPSTRKTQSTAEATERVCTGATISHHRCGTVSSVFVGEAPTTIGRYRVLSTLGTGAMGEVFRAKDERLGRDVAIKRVKNVFGQLTSIFHARFDAEARALAALAHPSVVQVFDVGYEDETPYLVMELVEGPSLRQVLDEKGPLAMPAARALGIQLARALEAGRRTRRPKRSPAATSVRRRMCSGWP